MTDARHESLTMSLACIVGRMKFPVIEPTCSSRLSVGRAPEVQRGTTFPWTRSLSDLPPSTIMFYHYIPSLPMHPLRKDVTLKLQAVPYPLPLAIRSGNMAHGSSAGFPHPARTFPLFTDHCPISSHSLINHQPGCVVSARAERAVLPHASPVPYAAFTALWTCCGHFSGNLRLRILLLSG